MRATHAELDVPLADAVAAWVAAEWPWDGVHRPGAETAELSFGSGSKALWIRPRDLVRPIEPGSPRTILTVRVLYVRAAIALALPALADVIVPAWLVTRSGGGIDIGSARFLGLPLLAAGCWLLLDSVFMRFAHEGRGTLAPVDPPRFVVRGGAYRVVRNPMYVANVAIVVGSGIVFQCWYLFVWATVLFVAFHLFVISYEEPTLARKFGEDYDTYRRSVGRWIPRWPRRRERRR